MATATVVTTDVKIALELSVAEAQYVHAALLNLDPVHLDGDLVFEALGKVLESTGVGPDYTAAG